MSIPVSYPSVALVFVPNWRFGLLPSLVVLAVIGTDHSSGTPDTKPTVPKNTDGDKNPTDIAKVIKIYTDFLFSSYS